jgi:hypothetical protein
MGSEVIALKGIVANDIGSDLGVKTRVTAGIDYHVAKELYSVTHELASVIEKQNHILQKLGAALNIALKSIGVSNDKREQIDGMWYEVYELQKKKVKLEEDSGALADSFKDKAEPRIEVSDVLYHGTEIIVSKYEFQAVKALKGPLAMEPDEVRRKIEIMPRGEENKGVLAAPVAPPVWMRVPEDKEVDNG